MTVETTIADVYVSLACMLRLARSRRGGNINNTSKQFEYLLITNQEDDVGVCEKKLIGKLVIFVDFSPLQLAS